jgi:TonB family protein
VNGPLRRHLGVCNPKKQRALQVASLLGLLLLLPTNGWSQSENGRLSNANRAFIIETSVVFVSGAPMPVYPAALRSERLVGEVLARFVVDTSGLVELTSMKILKATHPLFVESVRMTVAKWRFTPAKREGKLVRQLVQRRFDFVPPKQDRPHESRVASHCR